MGMVHKHNLYLNSYTLLNVINRIFKIYIIPIII